MFTTFPVVPAIVGVSSIVGFPAIIGVPGVADDLVVVVAQLLLYWSFNF